MDIQSVSLKEYVEKIFDEKEKSYSSHLDSERRVVDKAMENLERRLDALNNLRQEVLSDRSEYLTKAEYAADHKTVGIKIDNHSKLIYIGLGMVLVLEIMFRLVKF
ncbi:MAG: hypothetical protein AUJ54_06605 [Ignavibacteria bacterium CG1_02_37_35]|nr:MAG: hypothetical protein AUJ54_06605 [Ignavibacteria bacterium CG1_02_37_35]